MQGVPVSSLIADLTVADGGGEHHEQHRRTTYNV